MQNLKMSPVLLPILALIRISGTESSFCFAVDFINQLIRHTGGRLNEGAALMELDDHMYVNIEELGDYSTKHQEPQETDTKPVRTDAVARVETVCLALLCFLLLTAVIAVGSLYDRDFNQLSRDLANRTAEKDQLLVRYQNLTDELNKAMEDIGTCPGGWRHFSCSCYFLSPTRGSWATGRQACLNKGAELVFIDSRGEMVFLNKLGAHVKFWIGLSRSFTQSKWMWTDGRSLGTAYWQSGHPLMKWYYGTPPTCAAFNRLTTAPMVRSWTSEICSHSLQWVCKRPAEMSPVSW